MRRPTGVRKPVAIMSIRPRAGEVQALTQPGRRVALSRRSISSALVDGDSAGHTRPSTAASGGGAQLEYQRARGRAGHSERGRSRMMVSAIAYDAGSVAVSARPILPNTVATSLTCAIARS